MTPSSTMVIIVIPLLISDESGCVSHVLGDRSDVIRGAEWWWPSESIEHGVIRRASREIGHFPSVLSAASKFSRQEGRKW